MGTLVVGSESYEMVAPVGKGTFGVVTQGWRRSTGEMVAIKVLRNEGHQGRVARNELRLLRALQEVDPEESHIIRFLDSFTDGPCTYLVFELLEQNLYEFQKKNNFQPLPVRHIRTITAQILAALVKLQELSIIHADLKPENIMLVDQTHFPFRVKLIDFGSASISTEIHHIQEPYIQSRFYRAPEILLGLPFCQKMDMWSLGCVVAELHLGWPLYPGSNEYEQICYICCTLGLPRGEMLHAATKTWNFFQQAPHPDGSWQLRPLAPGAAKQLERRKFVISSLDQLVGVNVHQGIASDQEMLAEHCHLGEMVELLKGMLTWEAQFRIPPSAALQHPFISLQHLQATFKATRYYQLCQQDLMLVQKDIGTVGTVPSTMGTNANIVGTSPGVAETMPGVMMTIPGTLGTIPGVLRTMSGILATIPGTVGTIPGVVGTESGMVTSIPGRVGTVLQMVGAVPSMVGSAFTPIQKATTQMDKLSLAEPGGDNGGKAQQDICPAPIPPPPHCGPRGCQHRQWCRMEPPTPSRVVLGWRTREQRCHHSAGSVAFGDIVEQDLPGRSYSVSHTKIAPVTRRDPEPPRPTPVPKDKL
ncbi:homeodomain-interacting protein kinase 4 [Heliangelus exortis]|uniref:homeodomain-interacting protein kinase 4 n=1 Tax=Heliangelus exortis TaxID=472823 RepID=UPI003A8FF9FF